MKKGFGLRGATFLSFALLVLALTPPIALAGDFPVFEEPEWVVSGLGGWRAYTIMALVDTANDIHLVYHTGADSLVDARYIRFDFSAGVWCDTADLWADNGLIDDLPVIALDSSYNLHICWGASDWYIDTMETDTMVQARRHTLPLYRRRTAAGIWQPPLSSDPLTLCDTSVAKVTGFGPPAIDPMGGIILFWSDLRDSASQDNITTDSKLYIDGCSTCAAGGQLFIERLDADFNIGSFSPVTGFRVTGNQTVKESVACDSLGIKCRGASPSWICVSSDSVLHMAWDDDRFVGSGCCISCSYSYTDSTQPFSLFGEDHIFYQSASIDPYVDPSDWTWSSEELLSQTIGQRDSSEGGCGFYYENDTLYCVICDDTVGSGTTPDDGLGSGGLFTTLRHLQPQIISDSHSNIHSAWFGRVFGEDYSTGDSTILPSYKAPQHRFLSYPYSSGLASDEWVPELCTNPNVPIDFYSDLTKTNAKQSRMAVDQYDNLHMIWRSSYLSGSTDQNIVYNLMNYGGAFDGSNVVEVSSSDTTGFNPFENWIVCDRYGHVHVFWRELEYTGGQDVLYHVRGINTGDPDLSSVEIAHAGGLSQSNDDSVFVCPGGGGTGSIKVDTIRVTVTVHGELGDPIAGVPADSIRILLSYDPFDTQIHVCAGDTLNPASDTDSLGRAWIDVSAIGGCGYIFATATVCGRAINDTDTVLINSPDINGDGTVDYFDTFKYQMLLSAGTGWCGDFEHVQTPGTVTYFDTFKYSPHVTCTCPGNPKNAVSPRIVNHQDGENLDVSGDLVVDAENGRLRIELESCRSLRSAYIELSIDPKAELLSWQPGDMIRADLPIDVVRLSDHVIGITVAQLGEVGLAPSGTLAEVALQGSESALQQTQLRQIVLSDRNFELNSVMRGAPNLAADAETDIPKAFYCNTAPNPFNPTVTIHYGLPSGSPVTMEIFTVSGRRVKTLSNGNESAGRHSVIWNGKDERGKDVSSGIYLMRIQTSAETETMRLVLLR
ncbi:MAG: T9SS type A sorting domain-containing protein [Candidatus Eisenbacteria bacterium]|nr:T9SS type A sorting domain-containing protein [Candidatus Eisenbacteria bacterium]